MSSGAGFMPGAIVGAAVALAALFLTGATAGGGEGLGVWVQRNLGHSSWLFAGVLVAFVLHLTRLRRLLAAPADPRRVVELDQLTDVWIHLFVGIGVIWTAVGMRSALQLALADADQALADSAGSMLKKLVDGGILLALSTTIVGAMGGYLLRLGKTLYAGAALHGFYETQQRQELAEILTTLRRLEGRLGGHPAQAGEGPHEAR